MFFSDLVKHIEYPIEVDFIKCSLYEGMNQKALQMQYDIETNIKDKTIFIVDDIFDSSNVTTSPWTNLFSVKYTISTSVDDTNPATCAIESLVEPTIFSPNIAFVFKDKPLGRVILSKVGLLVSIDSNTPTMFTTSGQFREISLSSTLNPYPVALVMPV